MGLIHLDPLYEEERLDKMRAEAAELFGNTFVAEEGVEYIV